MRVTLSDGRILIGVFLCTDRDENIIIGSCAEYLNEEEGKIINIKVDRTLIPLFNFQRGQSALRTIKDY